MTIDVVIPVLDEEARIGERLDELGAVDGIGEIFVVDGGSSDRTIEVASSFPSARIIRSGRGRARQMNEGAARSSADVLLFLHADVSLPMNAGEQIEKALTDPETVGGAFRIRTVDEQRKTWWRPLLRLADLRSRYSTLPYGDQGIFVRTEVFRRLGGFADLPLMEDLEFSRRLRRTGTIRILPARVRVSGRRFLERPVYYTLMINTYPLLFRLGVPAGTLARWYRPVR